MVSLYAIVAKYICFELLQEYGAMHSIVIGHPEHFFLSRLQFFDWIDSFFAENVCD